MNQKINCKSSSPNTVLFSIFTAASSVKVPAKLVAEALAYSPKSENPLYFTKNYGSGDHPVIIKKASSETKDAYQYLKFKRNYASSSLCIFSL